MLRYLERTPLLAASAQHLVLLPLEFHIVNLLKRTAHPSLSLSSAPRHMVHQLGTLQPLDCLLLAILELPRRLNHSKVSLHSMRACYIPDKLNLKAIQVSFISNNSHSSIMHLRKRMGMRD